MVDSFPIGFKLIALISFATDFVKESVFTMEAGQFPWLPAHSSFTHVRITLSHPWPLGPARK